MTSLWLSPNDQDLQEYQSAVDELSQRFGTPSFEPHITLHPFINWNTNLEKEFEKYLSNQLPLRLSLSNLSSSYTFYQCLYLRTTDTDLTQLWKWSLDFFKIEYYEYMPHLSLLYGDFDKEIIQNLIQEYRKRLDRVLVFDTIKVMKTGEDIEKWTTLQTFEL